MSEPRAYAPDAGAPRRLVFAHANSFPSGTYRQLFDAWRAAGLEVHAIDRLGHDPRYPVSSNWPNLRDQLIQFIEAHVPGPADLVGHSLGGYLCLMVASRRPDLARGVVMLDSPVLSGWKARALQLAKATGLGERFSPARVSRRRRQQWTSREAARAHFASKPVFARWAPGVLDDYLDAGIEVQANAAQLRFDREIESAIYDSLPHHLDRLLRAHPLQVPLALVHGTESAEVRTVGLRATERLARGRVSAIEGTHLFPMEQPAQTAARVLQLVREMAQDAGTPRL